jgi:hypothetical protein
MILRETDSFKYYKMALMSIYVVVETMFIIISALTAMYAEITK